MRTSLWLKNAPLALLFACILWYITDQKNREELQVWVVVEIESPMPDEVVVTYGDLSSSEPPRVNARVSAPRAAYERWAMTSAQRQTIKATKALDPKAVIGVEQSLTLAGADLRMVMPNEFRLVADSFQPPTIRYTLRQVERGIKPVEVELADLPEGWEVARKHVYPVPAQGSPKLMTDPRVLLRTAPVRVGEVLRADPSWEQAQSAPHMIDLDVQVLPPEGGGITPARETARLVVTVRPRLEERTFQIAPSIVIDMPGMPHKVEPVLPAAPEVAVTLRGPAALLADERAVRKELRVLAIFPRGDERKIDFDRPNPFRIEVCPPPGVEVVKKPDVYDVKVYREPAPTADGGE